MKRVHIWFTVILACFSFFGFKIESEASVVWGKNEDGIYVNDQGQPIERAVKKGIDVSKHQGEIDWETVKETDVEFAIIRCGVGENIEIQDDSQWLRNATECERLNIPYGVYLYSYADTEAKAKVEAEHVLRLVEGRNLSYPIFYDLEDKSISNLTPEQYMKNAKAFCETLEAAGYETGIYASMSWFNEKLNNSWFNGRYKWIARWNSYCGYEGSYQMWQSTQTGIVNGISTSVDINFLIEDRPEKGTISKAESAAYNKHKLGWKTVTGVEGYEIWCKVPGKTEYSLIRTVNGVNTTAEIGKRTTGKNYYYKIRAFKTINGTVEYGDYSAVKKVKAIPAKVDLKSVKRTSKKQIKISWSKVAGANGYKIYRATSKTGKYSLIKTIKKGSTTSVKLNYTKGKKYFYKIRAYRTVSKKEIYGNYSTVKSCK